MMRYKFITKLVISLTVLNMLSWMKEKGVDFLGQYIGVCLSFSICVVNKRWRTATHRRFWQVFLMGGDSILHLFTCEILYTNTFQHTSGTTHPPHTHTATYTVLKLYIVIRLSTSRKYFTLGLKFCKIYISSLRYRCFWFQINLAENWDDRESS